MPSSTQSHARSHALLLLQKLLNLRDSASPLTLILDTLEQSAAPVVQEFLSRAKLSKSKTIYLSSSVLRRPPNADIFIKTWGANKSPDSLRAEISSHYPPPSSNTSSSSSSSTYKTVVVIDGLNGIASAAGSNLSMFLSSLITPAVSLVAVYHLDVPLVPPPHAPGSIGEPSRGGARGTAACPSRSGGLAEGREGVLIGLGGAEKRAAAGEGLVLEMELRRRSGRAVAEKFVLVPRSSAGTTAQQQQQQQAVQTSKLYLLSDHPAFRDPSDGDQDGGMSAAGEGEGGEMETTFNLGLTEKQRRDREGIVLPYFDAQTDIGAGEGGRILYEMGREDDFDDEEDEI
ncbi:hypothetical protein Daesc_006419 [Daldinia eschscholtzii]|uniref:Elongator complex protein 5 n=1 Tax=Daldinia eschscholtzii TaxID=292717 RepID=A0AAX6MHC0_9PEZI